MCLLACPLVYSERKSRGRLSCLSLFLVYSLSPGVLREAPGEDLFAVYVACLLVLC